MPDLFYSIIFISRDIAVNWFTWEIIQLRNRPLKIEHRLMYEPHGLVSYGVRIFRVFATIGLQQ